MPARVGLYCVDTWIVKRSTKITVAASTIVVLITIVSYFGFAGSAGDGFDLETLLQPPEGAMLISRSETNHVVTITYDVPIEYPADGLIKFLGEAPSEHGFRPHPRTPSWQCCGGLGARPINYSARLWLQTWRDSGKNSIEYWVEYRCSSPADEICGSTAHVTVIYSPALQNNIISIWNRIYRLIYG